MAVLEHDKLVGKHGLAGRVWFDMCPFPSGAATGQ